MKVLTVSAAALAVLSLVATPAQPSAVLAGETLPAVAPAAAADAASPDFDGDGKVDFADVHSVGDDFSAVVVRYGSGATLDLSASVLIGVDDAMSSTPLARDFNGDGYTDLALTSWAIGKEAKLIVVLGSSTGLVVGAAHAYAVPGTGKDRSPEAIALLTAPVPRLVVGAVSSRISPSAEVAAYDLGTDGLPSGAPAVLRPGKGVVPKLSDIGSFGYALAASGNRLFVGAPWAKVSGHKEAGAVVSLVFGKSGAASGKLITQATAGVPGSPGTRDHFGWGLAARDGYLAVGTPGDSVGSIAKTGSVQLFTLTAKSVKPVKRIAQSSAGVPGKAERGDSFGQSVELGAVCTGRPAVIVGGPGEVITKGHERDGSVWVIPLKITPACPARQLWEGHGIGGKPTYLRGLGHHVAVIRQASDVADQIVMAGEGWYSEGPNGVLAIWSAQTLSPLLHTEDLVYGLAGR